MLMRPLFFILFDMFVHVCVQVCTPVWECAITLHLPALNQGLLLNQKLGVPALSWTASVALGPAHLAPQCWAYMHTHNHSPALLFMWAGKIWTQIHVFTVRALIYCSLSSSSPSAQLLPFPFWDWVSCCPLTWMTLNFWCIWLLVPRPTCILCWWTNPGLFLTC